MPPASPPALSLWKAFSIVWQSERKLPPLECIVYFWMLLVSWWSTECRMMRHAGGRCGSFSERRAAAEHLVRVRGRVRGRGYGWGEGWGEGWG